MSRKSPVRSGDAALTDRLARVEESLAHLAKLQESILEAAGEGIYGTDIDGRITFMNPAAAGLLGYQPEELIGKPAHETIHHSHPDGSPFPESDCCINQAFLANRTHHAEDEVFWKKDGTSFPASFTYTPLEDEGRVVGGVLVFRDITERKQAQERLAKSERDLREAQEVAHIGSWSRDLATNTMTWSDELFRIYGVDPQTFTPSYAAAMKRVLPEDRGWIEELVAAAIEDRGSFRFDHRVVHPDGSVRWVEKRGQVVESEGQLCLVGTAMDITDRVEAEAHIRESEERYRSIFENAAEGIYRSSLDGRILAVNPAAARILGFPSADEAMRSLHNLRHSYADPAQRDELIHLLMKNGSLSGFEVQMRRTDGSLVWVELNARVTGSPGKRSAYMEGMMLDISSRKAAEEYLNQSDARTKAIVSSVPDAILTFDEEGLLLDVNPAAERMFGYRGSDIVGTEISQLLDLQPHSASEFALSDDVRWVGAEGEVEGVARRSDGGRVPVEVAVTPTRLGNNRFFIAHVRDVTDRRRMNRARQELELQVAHMQKMEALGHLAGGIAHDFNNVLVVIQNYAAFIRQQVGPDSPVTSDIDQVLNASRRASALTRQLVMFSRKDSARPETLDLNDVVIDMENLLRRVIGEGIGVETQLRAPLPTILMDHGQLEQVIMNLALNARDAMPDGGRLTLATSQLVVDDERSTSKPRLQRGHYVVLTVSDTGCGIPAHVGERVFEPFFTSKGKGQGSGLGLATVFGIVKGAGADISFDSDEGFGTSFHLYLPVHAAAEAKLDEEPAADGLTVITGARQPRDASGPNTSGRGEPEGGFRD